MKTNLFNELAFIRTQTLKAMEGLTEEMADRIPDGFRNNIRWHLGHIYLVTEFLALSQLKLPLNLPEKFPDLFGTGKSPLDEDAHLFPLPTLPELKELLAGQIERIRQILPVDRLNETVSTITTSGGNDLVTPEQALVYNLYHEGMHFSTLSLYKRMLSK